MLNKLLLILLTIVFVISINIAEAQTLLLTEKSKGIAIQGGFASNLVDTQSLAFSLGFSVKRSTDIGFSTGHSTFKNESGRTFNTSINVAYFSFFPAKDWEGEPFTIESTIFGGIVNGENPSFGGWDDLSGKVFGFEIGISKNLIEDEGTIRPRGSFSVQSLTGDFLTSNNILTFDLFLGHDLFHVVPFYSYILNERENILGVSAVILI